MGKQRLLNDITQHLVPQSHARFFRHPSAPCMSNTPLQSPCRFGPTLQDGTDVSLHLDGVTEAVWGDCMKKCATLLINLVIDKSLVAQASMLTYQTWTKHGTRALQQQPLLPCRVTGTPSTFERISSRIVRA